MGCMSTTAPQHLCVAGCDWGPVPAPQWVASVYCVSWGCRTVLGWLFHAMLYGV